MFAMIDASNIHARGIPGCFSFTNRREDNSLRAAWFHVRELRQEKV